MKSYCASITIIQFLPGVRERLNIYRLNDQAQPLSAKKSFSLKGLRSWPNQLSSMGSYSLLR